ncbi:hypothetical protein AX17_002416 [Amanita inopinata Kibby_2008]|nr:hypothetical protein AX17_002416 [Amanita inopinata Kibby_2008]
MTIRTINASALKKVKNSVIGNPSAKRQIAQDEPFIRMLVESLNRLLEPQGSQDDDIRIEAAHIISSLSYGSAQAISTLIRAGAPQAILYAISRFGPTDTTPLRVAFARALRAITVSIADVVGPSQWGLSPDYSNTIVRTEAKQALDLIFHTDSLDIYLPFLATASTPTGPFVSQPSNANTSTSIAQLIASGIRNEAYRASVAEWLPPSDRVKEARSTSSRRWEKASTTNVNSPARFGGWVAMALTSLITSRDAKLQEAALSALAALAKDNPAVATPLTKTFPERDAPSALSTILRLSKSKPTEVKLAACLCATHIFRASSPPLPTFPSSPYPPSNSTDIHETCGHTVMHILIRILSVQADEYSTNHRTRACYVLYHLVHDEQSLCLTAYEQGCLDTLAALIRETTLLEAEEEWGDDEAESVLSLREGVLTLASTLSLLSPEIRRCIADDLKLLPYIKTSLLHKHYGIRYAACQCVRALSRSVQVLRTNLVDTGVGMAVLKIIMRGFEKGSSAKERGEKADSGRREERQVEGGREGEEDRRVLGVALAVVCNCVNDFSPLRSIYMARGLLPRLIQFIKTDDEMRKDGLWALKNLLTKTSVEEKREIMGCLGWDKLVELFDYPDPKVQEQAYSVIRNLSENEESIDLVFQEIGVEVLLGHIRGALESTDDDVTQQAALALANLVNGSDTSYTIRISTYPRMLSALHTCLSDRNIRRPVASIICELARVGGVEGRKALVEEGFPRTLKKIVEWAGSLGPPVGALNVGSPGSGSSLSVSPGSRLGGLHVPGHNQLHQPSQVLHHRLPSPHRFPRIEDDKKLTDMARLALDWLEHGDVYSGCL